MKFIIDFLNKLINLMDGSITVESEEKKGSKFSVKLNLRMDVCETNIIELCN